MRKSCLIFLTKNIYLASFFSYVFCVLYVKSVYFCYLEHPVHCLGPPESSSARWGPPTMPFWTSRSCAKWTSIREATHLHKQFPRTDCPYYSCALFTFVSSTSVYNVSVSPRELQRDVVYLGWPIAPSYMSPNEGEVGEVAGSQPMSRAVHMEPK